MKKLKDRLRAGIGTDVPVKPSLPVDNESLIEPVETDTDIASKLDAELFGFGTKYESKLTYTKLSDYTGNLEDAESLWEGLKTIAKQKESSRKTDIAFMESKLAVFRKNLEIGLKVTDLRVVKVDSNIVDEKKNKSMLEKLEAVFNKNKDNIDAVKDLDTGDASKLHSLNKGWYETIVKLRKALSSGITPVRK